MSESTHIKRFTAYRDMDNRETHSALQKVLFARRSGVRQALHVEFCTPNDWFRLRPLYSNKRPLPLRWARWSRGQHDE